MGNIVEAHTLAADSSAIEVVHLVQPSFSTSVVLWPVSRCSPTKFNMHKMALPVPPPLARRTIRSMLDVAILGVLHDTGSRHASNQSFATEFPSVVGRRLRPLLHHFCRIVPRTAQHQQWQLPRATAPRLILPMTAHSVLPVITGPLFGLVTVVGIHVTHLPNPAPLPPTCPHPSTKP